MKLTNNNKNKNKNQSDFGHTWTVTIASQWKCCSSLGEASKSKALMHLSNKTHNTYFNVKHPK